MSIKVIHLLILFVYKSIELHHEPFLRLDHVDYEYDVLIQPHFEVAPYQKRIHAVDTEESCSYGRGTLIHIGTKKSSSFEPRIHVCFDKHKLKTYWTKHYLDASNIDGIPEVRGTWSKKFFGLANPHEFYRKISKDTDKGHLTPSGDFSSEVERKMTFFYINAAPQNRILNRGTWNRLEQSLRKRVDKKLSSIKVITGSGGSLKHPRVQGEKVNYPEYFFKIVVLPSGNKEVYIGLNNFTKYHPVVPKLCTTVVDGCGWAGSIYCCEMDKRLMKKLGVVRKDLRFEQF